MKRTLLELLFLAGLAAAAGGLSNLARSGNAEKHLAWVSHDYPDARKPRAAAAPGGAGAVPAPAAAGGPAVSPPSPAPSAGGSGGELPAPTAEVEEKADGEPPMIDFAELIEEARGGALLIDGRRTREYQAGHIPGAVCISAWESPGEKVSALLEKGAVLEAPVVVYCGSSKECEDSKIVSGVLKQAGFVNIKIYRGGFPDWEKGAPKAVVKGDEPGELDLDSLPKEATP